MLIALIGLDLNPLHALVFLTTTVIVTASYLDDIQNFALRATIQQAVSICGTRTFLQELQTAKSNYWALMIVA